MAGVWVALRGYGVLSTVTTLRLPHSLQTQVQTLFGSEGGQGPASLGGVGWVPPGLGASHTWGHCWDGGARPHTRGTMLRWGVQPYTTPGRRPIRKDPLSEGEAPPRGTRAAPHLPSRLPLRGPPRRAERRGALTSGDVTTAGGRGG